MPADFCCECEQQCRATNVIATHLFHGYMTVPEYLRGSGSIDSSATTEEKDAYDLLTANIGFNAGTSTAELRSILPGRLGTFGDALPLAAEAYTDLRDPIRYKKITRQSNGIHIRALGTDPETYAQTEWTWKRVDILNEHTGTVVQWEEWFDSYEHPDKYRKWAISLTTGDVTETGFDTWAADPEWGILRSLLDVDGVAAEYESDATSGWLTVDVPANDDFDTPAYTQGKSFLVEDAYTLADCLADANAMLSTVPLLPLPSPPAYNVNDTADQPIEWNKVYAVEYTGWPLRMRISTLETTDPGPVLAGKWWPEADTSYFAQHIPIDAANAVFGGYCVGRGLVAAKARVQKEGQPACLVLEEQPAAVSSTVAPSPGPEDGTNWVFDAKECFPDATISPTTPIVPGDLPGAWGRITIYRECFDEGAGHDECCSEE